MTTKMIPADEFYEGKLTSCIYENSEHIEILDDTNLEYDTYFNARKKQLGSTIQSVDNGTMKMHSEDEFYIKIKNLEKNLHNTMQINPSSLYLQQ